MKKIGIIFLLCALLCGCAAAPTYETLGGDIHQAAISLKEAVVSVPEGAAEMAIEQGTYWVCDDFDLQVQILSGGDLRETVSALSGLDVDSLTVMTSAAGEMVRYEWVWTAMSEAGQMLCRGLVLDDGAYHYCLTAIGPAEQGEKLNSQWNDIFSSFHAV